MIDVSASKNRDSKYWHKLIKLQREISQSTVILIDFNNHLTIIEQIEKPVRIKKNEHTLGKLIKCMLMKHFTQPQKNEYTSPVHIKLSSRLFIIFCAIKQSNFCAYKGIISEITNHKISGKSTNIYKSDGILLIHISKQKSKENLEIL